MKRNKRFFPFLLTTCIISCAVFGTPVHADNVSSTYASMAINAAKDFFGWSDTTVLLSEPLYDFNGANVAYCVDIQSQSKNGYVILSTSLNDDPIIEMSSDTTSPYDSTINQGGNTLIYGGVENYFFRDQHNSYYGIQDKTPLPSDAINWFKTHEQSHSLNSQNITQAKSARNKLLHLSQAKHVTCFDIVPPTQVILNVPNYQWHLGCAPTSAAMALKYDYPNKISNYTTLEQQLAICMATTASGSTFNPMIPAGISTAMLSCYTVSVNAINTTFGYSTFSDYETDLKNNHPTLITVLGSTITTTGYPNGFGDHTICGVGFYEGSGGEYFIVHDTSTGDGNVWINYNSSQLGTFNYTRIH